MGERAGVGRRQVQRRTEILFLGRLSRSARISHLRHSDVVPALLPADRSLALDHHSRPHVHRLPGGGGLPHLPRHDRRAGHVPVHDPRHGHAKLGAVPSPQLVSSGEWRESRRSEVTVNLKQSVGEEFEQRASRAEFFAQQSSSGRDPLLFASKLLRDQARLAHTLESVALTGTLEEDVERLLPLIGTLLHVAAAYGPQALAEEARKRIEEEKATARTRLLVYWSGDADDYLARAMLQPYAEVLRAHQSTPDRLHKRGHCPFCGGAPIISVRKAPADAEAGLRLLRCALCALEWNVNRIYCPACFEEDPYKLPLFRSDAHPNVL